MKLTIKEIKSQNFKLIKQFKRKKASYFVKCNKRIIKVNSTLYDHLLSWIVIQGKRNNKLAWSKNESDFLYKDV
jgi:hypothetical protein